MSLIVRISWWIRTGRLTTTLIHFPLDAVEVE